MHKLAGSRHALGDWILRATMIARSWDGLRTRAIAAELGRHPQTIRERLVQFNAQGVERLGTVSSDEEVALVHEVGRQVAAQT